MSIGVHFEDDPPVEDGLIYKDRLSIRETEAILMQRALCKVISAWEKLAGPQNYSTREVSDWLIRDMAPAINEARKAICIPDKYKRRRR